MKKIARWAACLYIVLFISLAIVTNVRFREIYALPENFSASYSDMDVVNENGSFGNFVQAKLEQNQTSVDNVRDGSGTVVFRLFGLIPIRKVKVQLLPEEEVYVGGVPIGLTVTANGAIIVSDTVVERGDGKLEAKKNNIFKNGDIIRKINGQEINCLPDIEAALDGLQDGQVVVEYLRKNEKKQTQLTLLKNDAGKYKLGLWVRDDLSGIGTLTFVQKNDLHYAALGHPITDGNSGNIIPIQGGKVYRCNVLGIQKGERNRPGELRCLFLQNDAIGSIDKNTNFGIYGHMDSLESSIDANRTAKIGGRLSVVPGKAKIVSSISGIREEYDIEIIKASHQSKCADKSLVFRVKDKRLLELTGGIVQGMSGSPIVQNGKIVGAVTHVFLSDPTKGYGVYTDWMLQK